MWLCSICGFKNNNSSERCHGQNCGGERTYQAVEIPKAITRIEDETVEDWCKICNKKQFFTRAEKKTFKWRWRCNGCKKLFHRKNKIDPHLLTENNL